MFGSANDTSISLRHRTNYLISESKAGIRKSAMDGVVRTCSYEVANHIRFEARYFQSCWNPDSPAYKSP
jgi:hypothetical protein